ncbi:MAG: hypothetical protein ACRCUJ_07885 [Phocaeicola sp.]
MSDKNSKKVLPTSQDELNEFCREWFLNNPDVVVPSGQRAWAVSKVSCGEVPCSANYIQKRGMSVLKVLQYLGVSSHKVPDSSTSNEAILAQWGATNIKKQDGRYTYTFLLGCGHVQSLTNGTIRKIGLDGTKYLCPLCYKVPGKTKPLSFYASFLPAGYSLISRDGHEFSILHEKCCRTFRRGLQYILNKELRNSTLYCDVCEATCSTKTEDGYNSKIEREVILGLQLAYPSLNLQREVKYKDLVPTDRNYRCDVYIPELNTVIEITSKTMLYPHSSRLDNQGLSYKDNLDNKLKLLSTYGIRGYVVTSLKQVEDIVGSLLKDKEK